jgi:hypothetical protein
MGWQGNQNMGYNVPVGGGGVSEQQRLRSLSDVDNSNLRAGYPPTSGGMGGSVGMQPQQHQQQQQKVIAGGRPQQPVGVIGGGMQRGVGGARGAGGMGSLSWSGANDEEVDHLQNGFRGFGISGNAGGDAIGSSGGLLGGLSHEDPAEVARARQKVLLHEPVSLDCSLSLPPDMPLFFPRSFPFARLSVFLHSLCLCSPQTIDSSPRWSDSSWSMPQQPQQPQQQRLSTCRNSRNSSSSSSISTATRYPGASLRSVPEVVVWVTWAPLELVIWGPCRRGGGASECRGLLACVLLESLGLSMADRWGAWSRCRVVFVIARRQSCARARRHAREQHAVRSALMLSHAVLCSQ